MVQLQTKTRLSNMSNLIFITAALIATCNADNLTCYDNTKELVAFSKATTEQFNLNAAVFFNGLAKCRFPKALLSNNVQVQMVNHKIGQKDWQKLALSLKFAKFGAFFQPKSKTEAMSLIHKVRNTNFEHFHFTDFHIRMDIFRLPY